MKIERINENQIRCTLTREDLEKRNIRITELAYGSEKARLLFHDLMEQASSECGFEADDIPLVVEAIPVSIDKLVLVVTKVEDPEELDTRFSRFAPGIPSAEVQNELRGQLAKRADEILDLFKSAFGPNEQDAAPEKQAERILPQETKKQRDKKKETLSGDAALMRLFAFANMDDALNCVRILSTFYKGDSAFYKSYEDGRYCLLAKRGDAALEDFNRACNILSEYGTCVGQHNLSGEYLDEHYDRLVADNAIGKLSV